MNPPLTGGIVVVEAKESVGAHLVVSISDFSTTVSEQDTLGGPTRCTQNNESYLEEKDFGVTQYQLSTYSLKVIYTNQRVPTRREPIFVRSFFLSIIKHFKTLTLSVYIYFIFQR